MSAEDAYNQYCNEFGKPPRTASQLLKFTQTKTDIKLTWKQAGDIIKEKQLETQNDPVRPSKPKVSSDTTPTASIIQTGSISHSQLRAVSQKRTHRRAATDTSIGSDFIAQKRAHLRRASTTTFGDKKEDDRVLSSTIERGSISHSRLRSVGTTQKAQQAYCRYWHEHGSPPKTTADLFNYAKSKPDIAVTWKQASAVLSDPPKNKEEILSLTAYARKESTEIGLKLVERRERIERLKQEKAEIDELEKTYGTVEKKISEDDYAKELGVVKSTLTSVSQRRAEKHSHFLDTQTVVSKQYKTETEEAETYTNKLLSEKASGDPSSKDTLIHVLASMSKESGRKCLFFNSKDGVSDSSGASSGRFFSEMESEASSKCVLKLSNLSGLDDDDDDNDGDDDGEEEKLSDDIVVVESTTKKRSLKEKVSELKTCIALGKSHPTLQRVRYRLASVHKVEMKDILITDVNYGSCTFEYTVANTPNINDTFATMDDAMKEKFTAFEELKIHPLMWENRFDIADFDERGHKSFASENSTFQVGPTGREKQYTQPHGWTGYGLKVLDGRYGGDHTWLDPFQHPNSWYRAFHGTNVNVGKNILANGLMAGGGQAYQNNISPLDGRPIGAGVYCSPVPTEAAAYAKITQIDTKNGPKRFYFMFQCCVDPDRTHQTSNPPYWVIRTQDASTAIRPYRILLQEAP